MGRLEKYKLKEINDSSVEKASKFSTWLIVAAVLLFICVLISRETGADIYAYRDSRGVLRFTACPFTASYRVVIRTKIDGKQIPVSPPAGERVANEYQIYQSNVIHLIKKQWNWEGKKTDLEVTVRFGIRENGKIVGLRVVEESGDSTYDDSVLSAVQNSIPLPVVPANCRDAFSDVKLTFRVSTNGLVADVLLIQPDLALRLPKPIKSKSENPVPVYPSVDLAYPRISVLPPISKHVAKKPLSPSELFQQLKASVFVVLAAQSAIALRNGTDVNQGSAVAVSSHYLLTNCHILKRKSFIVIMQDKRIKSVHVARGDRRHDRCILEVKDGTLEPIRGIRKYKDLVIGEKVYTIGAPAGLEKTLDEGLVSGLREIENQRLVQTSASISPGSSGGGLFDQYGNLVGITTWLVTKSQNLNFAIAAEEFWR